MIDDDDIINTHTHTHTHTHTLACPRSHGRKSIPPFFVFDNITFISPHTRALPVTVHSLITSRHRRESQKQTCAKVTAMTPDKMKVVQEKRNKETLKKNKFLNRSAVFHRIGANGIVLLLQVIKGTGHP